MGKQLLRRLLLVVPIMLGVFTVVFILIRIVPGDPILSLVEEGIVTPERLEALRHEYGTDRPVLVQYFDSIGRLLRLDLGTSFHTGQPVWQEIKEFAPYSIQLTFAAMAIAAVFGLLAGVMGAIKHNTWLDTLATFGATVGIAAPDFWLGLMLIFLFVLVLGWFPLTEVGFGPEFLILPAITLAVRPMASIARLARASTLEVLSEGYIVTARAKGLRERTVIGRHALRNALIPVITIMGIDLAATLSNAMVIEVVFARPGLGRLVLTSITHKDFPVVQSTIMIISLAYVLCNIFVDIAYLFLDPRLRTSST